MSRKQIEGRRWFLQAMADREVAHTLCKSGHFAAACFHCQQAAEKALKAVLYGMGARVVLGHAVRELVVQCMDQNQDFGDLLEDAALLDQFYIPTRYPNGVPSPAIPSEMYTATHADAALQACDRILKTVRVSLEQQGIIEAD